MNTETDPNAFRVDVAEGKYSVLHDGEGKMTALRYGEPWGRSLVGDNLVFWLAVELHEARSRKEPWASVMTVATNRAIRAFREVSEVKQGVMTAVTKLGEVDGIQIIGLVDETKAFYTLDYLGFKLEDLEAP